MLVPVTRGTCASEKILAWQGCLPVLDSEMAHTAWAKPTRTWRWRRAGQHGTWKQRMGGFCGITKSKAEQGRGVICARSPRLRCVSSSGTAGPRHPVARPELPMGWYFDIPREGRDAECTMQVQNEALAGASHFRRSVGGWRSPGAWEGFRGCMLISSTPDAAETKPVTSKTMMG